MKYNFTLRIYQDNCNNQTLSSLKEITISNITLISKNSKFGGFCFYLGNQKKFGYSLNIKGKFHEVSGSNNYPTLTFNGDYIDIEVKNFPRFPAFYQDVNSAKNCLNGWSYTNYLNKGFPIFLLYRNIEFINN